MSELAAGYTASMRPVFADPKSDVIFKKIFGEKAHKRLLIELLNSLLELVLVFASTPK